MLRVMLLEIEVESGVFMDDCQKSEAAPVLKRFRIKEKFKRERRTCFSDLFAAGLY